MIAHPYAVFRNHVWPIIRAAPKYIMEREVFEADYDIAGGSSPPQRIPFGIKMQIGVYSFEV